MKKSTFGDRDSEPKSNPSEKEPILISSCASSTRSETSSERSDSITSSRLQSRKGLNTYKVFIKGYGHTKVQADSYTIESVDPYSMTISFVISIDQYHHIITKRIANVVQIDWENY